MNSIMFIGGGLMLLAAMISFALIFGRSRRRAAMIFAILWFFVCLVKSILSLGNPQHAPLTEIPVFFVVFCIPVLAGFLLSRAHRL